MRRGVTIAVGILCGDDGVVIAADCQETAHGYWKRWQGKVEITEKTDPVAALITAGAGRGGYADSLAQTMRVVFRNWDGKSWRDVLGSLGEAVHEFHTHHVAIFSDLPEVSIMYALQVAGYRPTLYTTDRSAVAVHGNHAAIGIGAAHAMRILDTMRWTPRNIDEGVALATYVIHHTKQNVADCGNSTTVACLQDGIFSAVRHDAVLAMEGLIDDYIESIEPSALSSLLGLGESVGTDATIRKMGKKLKALRSQRCDPRVRYERGRSFPKDTQPTKILGPSE